MREIVLVLEGVVMKVRNKNTRNKLHLFLGIFLGLSATSPITIAYAFPVGTGLTANHVIGQSDFTTGFINFSQATFFGAQPATDSNMFGISDLAHDRSRDLLYAADTHNHRFLVFDITNGVTNNMAATYVLGQPDFVTGGADPANPFGNTNTQNAANGCTSAINGCGVHRARSVAFARFDRWFFASDPDNSRILAWDMFGSITNGMQADYVLGQPDMTVGTKDTVCNNIIFGVVNECGMNFPEEIAYDNTNDRLFVADLGNNRVLVFDTSNGLTTGMAADYVLGQRDMDSNVVFSSCTGQTDGVADACGMHRPNSVTVDEAGGRLFVSDQTRVLVYDISNFILDGMSAVNILGQPDFATTTYNTSCGGGASGETNTNACGFGIFSTQVDYNATEDILYVSDVANHRVLAFDTSTITNGMAATGVLGQADYTTGYDPVPENLGGSTTASTFMTPLGVFYDSVFDQLFVADGGNHRILIFGANVGGTPVEITGVTESQTVDNGNGTTTISMVDDLNQDFVVTFPNGTLPSGSNTSIRIEVDNPTNRNRPRITIFAELPPGTTKSVSLRRRTNTVCIIDRGDAEFLTRANSVCDASDIFSIPGVGSCIDVTVKGDLGDNPNNPNDPDGLHEVEICRPTNAIVELNGLLHTLIELEVVEDAQTSSGRDIGCNTGKESFPGLLGLVVLACLSWRSRSTSHVVRK